MIGPDWKQRYLGLADFANLLEPVEISAVARVINPAALVFEQKPSVTTMIIAQYSCPPVFARRQGYFPIPMRKALPPFQFHYPPEAQIVTHIPHAPRHHPDFWLRQAPQ